MTVTMKLRAEPNPEDTCQICGKPIFGYFMAAWGSVQSCEECLREEEAYQLRMSAKVTDRRKQSQLIDNHVGYEHCDWRPDDI